MSEESPQIQASSGASRQGTTASCLSISLRVLTAIVLGVLLALTIFYGVPSIYQWIVLPYETRLARLENAQRRQADEAQRISSRLEDFRNRLNGLELQSDLFKQTVDELRTQLAGLENAQQASHQAVQAGQASSDERFAEVAQSVEAVNQSLEELDGKLAELAAALSETQGDLLEVDDRLAGKEAPVVALRSELRLVMAMELLTRSQLFLAQDNLGLARREIQAARDLIANLQRQAPAQQIPALQAILVSLEGALESLPANPLLAAENLEIAWRLLQQGLPENATATPAATISP